MSSMNSNLHRLLSIVGLVFVTSCFGCAGTDPVTELTLKNNETNIQKVGNAYILYATLQRNNGPESKEALVEFVTSNDLIGRNLKMMGIEREGFEDCFVSTVDGEPFSVRWGLVIESEGSAVPLVFEKTGTNGVRRVALSDSRILEVEDNRKYQSLWSGLISKEDAGPAAWESGQDVPSVDEAE